MSLLLIVLGCGFSWLAGIAFGSDETGRFLTAALSGVACFVAAAMLQPRRRPV